MQLFDDKIRLSASDLARHLGCRHLTGLDREAVEGRLRRPAWRDPALEILQQRGFLHEKRYLDRLRGEGLTIVEIAAPTSPVAASPASAERPDAGGGTSGPAQPTLPFTGSSADETDAVERVRAAMRDGADVIFQAPLEDGPWHGRADILRRVETPSDLGSWSYEVIDTKLATETRGGTILQLCLYSDLVSRIQGVFPEKMHVVSPGPDFPRQEYRTADFLAYYRLVRGRLQATMEAESGPPSTYPEPVCQCDICVWWQRCDARRREDDHLCLVAGMPALHAQELRRQGVSTLAELARRGLPGKPERGAVATYEKLQAQARLQLAGREAGEPRYERLPAEPGMGLARLPQPDAADVFLDFEGDRFLEEGGREYLLGLAWGGTDGRMQYRALWGLDRASERRAFETLIDDLLERWRRAPGMHIYHFAPYEPAALKRLMGRHASREDDIDRLLRAGRFVDLYDVVRHGVRASVESYSIKELERFTGYRRETDLREATRSLRTVSMALALDAADEIDDEIRASIESYNRDDCLSTADLQSWLENVRSEGIDAGETIDRPPEVSGDASEKIEERREEVQRIYDALTEGIPEEPADRTTEQAARWLLAQLLDYYRREDKGVWWEFFRMQELTDEDLLDERKALSGLTFVDTVGGTDKCPIHRYRFPPQECALRRGDKLREPRVDGHLGEVVALDAPGRTIDIKKGGRSADRHARAAFVHDLVPSKGLESSLLTIAGSIAAEGIDVPGPHRAARDLLLRRPPRRRGNAGGPLLREGESVVEAARRLARELDGGVLPVQGPPGSGKTFTGARVIVELLRQGRTVGVTAVSHKVIRNLLAKALEAAAEEGVPIRCVHKNSDDAPDLPPGLSLVGSNEKALGSIDGSTAVGGTAWLWSRDDAVGTLDTLIVDEAGQMSLAHVLSVSRAARNVILLGDPQQLQQPQQGSHPEGAEAAALVHILAGRKTMPPEQGLFLDETWRLPPPIARFTSELYYEGRLQPREGLEGQAILGDSPFAGSGLFVVPVEHEGNQSSSPEEVDAVERVVRDLLGARLQWRDRTGVIRPLEETDILVVSPYNAQVYALQERRPTLRVGTVDRFQGQEAPIVIYSMAASSAEDAPRGMGFLYEPNRFNVATSRAKCACILVASPRLFEPDCGSVTQMRLANGLCRFVELAKPAAR